MAISPVRAQRIPLFPIWTPLRGFRFRAGLTQQELADRVRASRTTISSLERRRSTPSVAVALALASELDASVEELFAADDLR